MAPSRPEEPLRADPRPVEETQLHTRILRAALEVDHCRAWWRHADPTGERVSAERAYSEWWFGDRSLSRVELLMQNMRARFDVFPPSMSVLQRWDDIDLQEATLVCHWHLQLSDPLYRSFTGDLLPSMRAVPGARVERDAVVEWVRGQGSPTWGVATRVQFASKLLSAAHEAGLVLSSRDPRPLGVPTVPDRALFYLLYLLRGVRIEGSLLDNPYLRSVGLIGSSLDARLRASSEVHLHRLGGVVELSWRHADLRSWASMLAASGAA